ncbi:MAG: hypothetical protein PHD21_07020, partial [Flavobacteriales bacterium]|nr:hypothetical protein [Flavobacteriales bacterium]
MKNKILVTVLAVLVANISYAQRANDCIIPEENPVRTTVVIDYFVCPPTIPIIYMEGIRQGVIATFLSRGRNDILDAQANLTPPMYNNAYYGYGNNRTNNAYYQNAYQITSPVQGAAPSVDNFVCGTPRDEVRNTGARYVVNGFLTYY